MLGEELDSNASNFGCPSGPAALSISLNVKSPIGVTTLYPNDRPTRIVSIAKFIICVREISFALTSWLIMPVMAAVAFTIQLVTILDQRSPQRSFVGTVLPADENNSTIRSTLGVISPLSSPILKHNGSFCNDWDTLPVLVMSGFVNFG